MTSLLRKSRRTTAPRTTRARTAISPAVLAAALLAAPAAAADPGGFVPVAPARGLPVATVPAMAEWPAVPAPPVPEFSGGRGPTGPQSVPGKVVALQKQPGADAPKAKDPDPNNLDPNDVRSIYEQRYGKLPGKREVFRLEAQNVLEDRILHELHRDDDPKEYSENKFPAPPRLAAPGAVYVPKTASYPPVKAMIEPGYVVHRRLYFEDPNSERYGWDLGFAQPMLSTLVFFRDALVFPAKLGSNPHERYTTSAGKCLPGTAVPYYLYPPEVDLWGATFAAGVYTGTAFFFP